MSDSYRSYAVSGTQLTTGDIPGQFTRAMREGPVKVVLMDGGGNDLLVGNRCKGGFDAPCKEVVTTVQTLFAQMQKDGVKDTDAGSMASAKQIWEAMVANCIAQ